MRLGPYGAAFLDRDGTINVKAPEGEYVTSPDQIELIPGAAEAIRSLNDHGIQVIVVTNQRGIALGRMTEANLDAVHAALADTLDRHAGAHVDAFYHCPHGLDECDCRKPQPGLVLRALTDHPAVIASESVMIGDQLTDVEAGRRAGTATVLLGADAPDLHAAVSALLTHVERSA